MKVGKRLKLVIAATTLASTLSLAGSALVYSQETTPIDADRPQTTQAQAESEATETKPEAGTTLETRIQQRKDALSLRLTTAQQTRLRARCKAAQTIITAHNQRVATIQDNRSSAYDRIEDHLTTILEKLDSQVDTAKLKAAIDSGKELKANFKDQLVDYRQTLNDLTQIDCVSDPTGFQALLNTARTQQTELAQTVAQIRKVAQETIKPELRTILVLLQPMREEVTN